MVLLRFGAFGPSDLELGGWEGDGGRGGTVVVGEGGGLGAGLGGEGCFHFVDDSDV